MEERIIKDINNLLTQLFQKMKESGYEWDAEKKELKEIEQNHEIKDDVLSRFAFYQYDDDTIYLSSLFVRESDRKCGYGSKILKAAGEVAKTFGISKIRLKVESNTWMEEWYKKNGYEYLSSEGKYNWLENRIININPDKIEQNPTWSEEDETIKKNISYIIRQYDKISKRNNQPCWYVGDCLLWMQNIKDRVQPKYEWSEEDYNEIETIACHLDNIDNECMAEVLRSIRDKYCHIIPQNTWK